MKKVLKWLSDGLGFEKQSKYVNEYFFRANMRASIYMSVVVIVLEIWMIIRMTNTIFEAGTSKVEDMIASIKDGFLLCQASSGMEDPKNWGIQLMVDIAREIKDGKLTGKIYSPIVMTGYVPDLLKSISMISDSIEAGGTGYCGKGYKEWVKVSDGGPYIKARIRLG